MQLLHVGQIIKNIILYCTIPHRNKPKQDCFVPLGSWNGGRATDVCIVRDSVFLQKLQPRDQAMVERGFKIQDILSMYFCYSSIKAYKYPHDSNKYTNSFTDCKRWNLCQTATARMKTSPILKNELPVSLLPLVDDIVLLCAIMKTFIEPLCSDDN